jgi:hypothetical protein
VNEEDRQREEAEQMQNMLSQMGGLKAPDSLRRKLLMIPETQRSASSWRTYSVAATLLLGVSVSVWLVLPDETSVQEQEIAQAREDLNVALTYLSKTTRRANAAISSSVSQSLSVPVSKVTVNTMSAQFGRIR